MRILARTCSSQIAPTHILCVTVTMCDTRAAQCITALPHGPRTASRTSRQHSPRLHRLTEHKGRVGTVLTSHIASHRILDLGAMTVRRTRLRHARVPLLAIVAKHRPRRRLRDRLQHLLCLFLRRVLVQIGIDLRHAGLLPECLMCTLHFMGHLAQRHRRGACRCGRAG